jgi:hypothetical protein
LVVFLLFPVHLETSFLSHTLLLTQKFRLAKILSIITHFFMCFYKSYVCKFINPIGYSFGLGGRNWRRGFYNSCKWWSLECHIKQGDTIYIFVYLSHLWISILVLVLHAWYLIQCIFIVVKSFWLCK